jgi:multidrug efflux system outer membrane protein
MLRLAVLLLIGGLLAQACAVGPDYEAPEARVPPAFVEATEGPFSAEATPDDLWQSLGDPDLDALIDRALSQNKSIAQALATLNETRALSGLAMYSLLPTVDINIDQQRNRQSGTDPFGFPVSGSIDRYRAGFDMIWEVDLFGSLRRANQAIRQRNEADAAALQAVELSIVAEVAQAYFSLRGAQEQLRVLQRNLDNQSQSVAILEASLAAGRGTGLDVARVKALERSIAAQRPQAQAAISRAEQRLAVLTAQPVDLLRTQLAPQRDLPAIPAMVAVGTPEAWLSRRPDVQEAERRLAESVSRVGLEMSEYYPKLTLSGGYGWISNSAGDLGSSEAERWNFGPALSWRILDFGRIKQNVLAAEARADRSYAAFEQTLLLAIEEAENGLAGYRAASQTAAALEEAVTQSRTGSRLARMRYDNGVADYLAVLDAERTQLDLEDRYARALTDRATALAALYKALGGDFAAVARR